MPYAGVSLQSYCCLLKYILRYSSGVPTTKSKFGTVPSEFILDDVMCKGTEASLFDCGYEDIDNCGGDEGAGVICSGISLEPGHFSHILLLQKAKSMKKSMMTNMTMMTSMTMIIQK